MVLCAQILTRRGISFLKSAHRLQLLRQEQSLGQELRTARRKAHGCDCLSVHLVSVFYDRREEWEGCQIKAERERVNGYFEGVR